MVFFFSVSLFSLFIAWIVVFESHTVKSTLFFQLQIILPKNLSAKLEVRNLAFCTKEFTSSRTWLVAYKNGADAIMFHSFLLLFLWTMCIFRETRDVNTAESQRTMRRYLPVFHPPAPLEVSHFLLSISSTPTDVITQHNPALKKPNSFCKRSRS